jgi:hypothetical protein
LWGHLWSGPALLEEQRWYPRFYVCPRSGLLRRVSDLRRKRRRGAKPQPECDPNTRSDGPNRLLRRIDGVWYAFDLMPVPRKDEVRRLAWDHLLRGLVSDLWRVRQAEVVAVYGYRRIYAARKRQLGKRELRRIDSFSCGCAVKNR